jgi:hypothetical protein
MGKRWTRCSLRRWPRSCKVRRFAGAAVLPTRRCPLRQSTTKKQLAVETTDRPLSASMATSWVRAPTALRGSTAGPKYNGRRRAPTTHPTARQRPYLRLETNCAAREVLRVRLDRLARPAQLGHAATSDPSARPGQARTATPSRHHQSGRGVQRSGPANRGGRERRREIGELYADESCDADRQQARPVAALGSSPIGISAYTGYGCAADLVPPSPAISSPRAGSFRRICPIQEASASSSSSTNFGVDRVWVTHG